MVTSEIGLALESLKQDINHREKRSILQYSELLELTRVAPQKVLRNIFQLFSDMVEAYVGRGEDEYPDDPESIGFIKYDCSRIFVNGASNPFFADRLFANRFVRKTASLRQGSKQNQMDVYEGPHGSGKSTFLDNLLRTFEEYTSTKDGQIFEVFWDITAGGNRVEVPCPSHDHPILIIPKKYRTAFLDKLLDSEKLTEFKHKLSSEKEYEWVFGSEACTICKSIFWALYDKVESLDQVLEMAKARPYKFDRSLGEGISVFNPGDKPPQREMYLSDKQIQEKLDQIFGINSMKYMYSRHAKTNNGIYVLMDVKSNNEERLLELHNIISEGVHKVGDIEEKITSLFIALMNPEDKEALKAKKIPSLEGRIRWSKILYVMDVQTEVNIYKSIFGEQITANFLPRVLDNFVRVVISSRMNADCAPLKEWIPNFSKYSRYCDDAGLLLRMEIYGGIIPPWLSEEDKKRFTVQIRKRLIAEGENEGNKGINGRDSINLFSEFFTRYGNKQNLINLSHVTEYFKHKVGKEYRDATIPKNFIASLVNLYDYTVLNEVKESLYFYNQEQIAEDILHYLWAINYDFGTKTKCKFTGKDIEVTMDFLKLMGIYIAGRDLGEREVLNLARDTQKKYIEMMAMDREKQIAETELYQELLGAYVRNLKERAFKPFLQNENFRDAVKAFGTKAFETFDMRMKEHVSYMIRNLEKRGYTEQGAKEICFYVIEQKLVEKFS